MAVVSLCSANIIEKGDASNLPLLKVYGGWAGPEEEGCVWSKAVRGNCGDPVRGKEGGGLTNQAVQQGLPVFLCSEV